jgi:ATP-dependent DNA helicase RecG
MDSLTSIPGVGSKTLEKLNRLKIQNPRDLLYHFPSRYIDFSHSINIKDAVPNENVTITGQVINFQNIYTRYGKNIQKATVEDKTGRIDLVWFNQPYLSNSIKIGEKMSFAGAVTLFQRRPTIIAPEHGQYNTGKIIAIYPETSGLSSKWFRKTIQNNLDNLISNSKDHLPLSLQHKYELVDLNTALHEVHLPKDSKALTQARFRLAIDEILSLQVQSYLNRKDWLQKQPKTIFTIDRDIQKRINELIGSLPFKLTESQLKVWKEIQEDLIDRKKVANRLIQGDVGSGKTIIAVLACYLAHLNNSLSLLVAPTEILAQQHFRTYQKILKDLEVPLFLLTGSNKIDLKKVPYNAMIISTHAAMYKKNDLQDRVSLLIVDEQHKFGVKQRSFLGNSLNLPHCLTMTATPIPRTVHLTLLGNLDLSTIDAPPKNRLDVKTFLVPNHKKDDCYRWVEDQIKKTKCQVYIVCPFIDISESMSSIKSAIKEFEYLSKFVFPNLNLALIHGKMKPEERNKIIEKFQNNEINILVTTPIIEVGVDIPNASVIIIQSADRFGLAQLHQLRGRVGRGQTQSYCYLFTESENEKALDRLKFLQVNHSGLKIAEYDLKTRGPGEAFSIVQHGFPSLKVASISDSKLISFSQQILKDILYHHPDLELTRFLRTQDQTEQTIVTN